MCHYRFAMPARLLAVATLVALFVAIAVGCSDPPPPPEPVGLPSELDTMHDPDGTALKSVADLLTALSADDSPPEATKALREAYADAIEMGEKLRRLGAFRQDLGLQGSALISDVQTLYYRQIDRLVQMRDSLLAWLASRASSESPEPLNPASGSAAGNAQAVDRNPPAGGNGTGQPGDGSDTATADDAPTWFAQTGETAGEDLCAVGSSSGDARAAAAAETAARARLGERVQGVVAAALAAIVDAATEPELPRLAAVQVWSLVAKAAQRRETAWGKPTADGKTTAFALVAIDLDAVLDVLNDAWQTVAQTGPLPGDRESWRAALSLASSQ